MTDPLTPAQLDGIRARVEEEAAITRLTVDRALLLVEVDRLRDYADTIDEVNADLVQANDVHRQRIRDVLAECDRAEELRDASLARTFEGSRFPALVPVEIIRDLISRTTP